MFPDTTFFRLARASSEEHLLTHNQYSVMLIIMSREILAYCYDVLTLRGQGFKVLLSLKSGNRRRRGATRPPVVPMPIIPLRRSEPSRLQLFIIV